MRRGRALLTAALACAAAGSAPGAASAANLTPTSHTSVVLQPFKFQPNFLDDAQSADSTLRRQGYTIERLFDANLDAYSTSRLSDFWESLESGRGAVVLSTHGDPYTFVVEAYGPTNQAAMLVSYNAYVQGGYSPLDIQWIDQSAYAGYCGIVITAAGIDNAFQSAQTIVFASSCYSASLAPWWTDARCVLGYPAICTIEQSLADYQTTWQRLDGAAGAASRTIAAAIAGTALSLYGSGATVLAPTVLAVGPPPLTSIECGDAGFVVFDAAMDTSVDPEVVVVGASRVRVENAAWTGPDRIDFTMEPLEYGDAAVRVRAGSAVSAGDDDLSLDGNTDPAGVNGGGPAGDDYEWALVSSCRADGPAAWVDGAEWAGGEVRWRSLREEGSRAYRLAGAASPAGAWTPASAETPATGSSSRYTIRPSVAFPFYRVEEQEALGGTEQWLPYSPVAARASERRASAPRPERAARSRAWQAAVAPPPHAAPGARDLAILYDAALDATGAVATYAADKSALGWSVATLAWSSPAFTDVSAAVDSLKGAGVDAILLLGRVLDGNAPGTTMPATMEPDSFSCYADFSLRSETILTLWDYERDVAEPDRVGPRVGYVPLASASEAWDFADKMADYEWNGKSRSNWDNFASWGWDIAWGYNSPAQIVADIESAGVLVPPSWEKEVIWGSEATGSWTARAATSLDAGQGIVLALATASAPDNPTHWLNAGAQPFFDPWLDLAPNFKYPLFLALSCGANQIDAVDADDLPVVVHDLLVVPERGIIGAIGPTRGFYEHYYARYARRFWELYALGTDFFVGDLHRAVRNSLLDESPGDEMMRLFCRLAILAGDPTTTLPGVDLDAVTAVERPGGRPAVAAGIELGAPEPNPFNPRLRIAYRVPHAIDATLRVFDVSGRLVATLAKGRHTAGAHAVDWEARDDAGRAVASGAYLLELRGAGARAVRRALLVR
jgi:hypothetical protein